METTVKQRYEMPSAEVILVTLESSLLEMSSRQSYQQGGDPFADDEEI